LVAGVVTSCWNVEERACAVCNQDFSKILVVLENGPARQAQLSNLAMKIANWGRQMLSDVIIKFLSVITSSSKG